MTSVQDREKLWPYTCAAQTKDTLVEPLLADHGQQQAASATKSEMPSAKTLQDFAGSVETVKSMNGSVKSSTATDQIPPLNIVLLVGMTPASAHLFRLPSRFHPRLEQLSAVGKLASSQLVLSEGRLVGQRSAVGTHLS